mgnify:CR=1 FL=1|tara:strand:- start:76923 stop:77108 length:186 start_codon:yes stop_codon:yes gene_type:complete
MYLENGVKLDFNLGNTPNKEWNVSLFYMAKEGESKIPSEIIVNTIAPKKGTRITMLGSKTK